ncbi:MAG: LLM class flavin-dependent oxidoreductase, partial [Acidimicrobiales bacterium]
MTVKVGITLPTFRSDAKAAIDTALAAESAGVHGVFCFDHLWPIGESGRPSLWWASVLAAVAALTSRVRIGPLVARTGLVPEAVVASSLFGLRSICGDRLIAGLGTGDHKSADEELRNGIALLGAAARRQVLFELCRKLSAGGIECFVGAGSEETNEAARAAGVGLNYWGVPAETVASEPSGPTSWAGRCPKDLS